MSKKPMSTREKIDAYHEFRMTVSTIVIPSLTLVGAGVMLVNEKINEKVCRNVERMKRAFR